MNRLGLIAAAFLGAAFCGFAQDVEQVFDPRPNGEVYAFAVQADGLILGGGEFTRVGGVARQSLARLLPDGNPDTSFGPLIAGSLLEGEDVLCLAVQPDGKILVGGQFLEIGGWRQPYLARLHPDGSLDTLFNPKPDRPVHALAQQSDGKIVVGGEFSSLGFQSHAHVGRLLSDGSVDSSFNSSAGSLVNCVALQPDGKILVGGLFTTLNGSARGRLGRLNADGSLDVSYDPMVDGEVHTLLVQPNGKLVVAGDFAQIDGMHRNRLARLELDGSVEPWSFIGAGANAVVRSLGLQADGRLLVSGSFSMLDGQSRDAGIGRLMGDGSIDFSFDLPNSYSAPSAIALQADGRILCGGTFFEPGGTEARHLRRLRNTSSGTESLSFTKSVITWLRGGTSPEVWRTWFDYSTNGQSWTDLGPGTRVAGGWALTGLALPEDAIVRARGWLTGGRGNGSGWWVESVMSSRPIIIRQPGPLSQWRQKGENVTFTVVAADALPLTYQWRRHGLDLPGLTTATLTLTNIQREHAGAYDVVVANAFSAVTSVVAVLRINLVAPDGFHFGSGLEAASFERLAVQPDGKILGWGLIAIPGVASFDALVRVDGNGMPDPSFNYSMRAMLNPSIHLQLDGKILLRLSTDDLFRINPDGTYDNGFHDWGGPRRFADGRTGLVFHEYAEIPAMDPAGGLFLSYVYSDRYSWSTDCDLQVLGECWHWATIEFRNPWEHQLARLDSDGHVKEVLAKRDFGYSPPNAAVSRLAFQPNGEILIGYAPWLSGQRPPVLLTRLNASGTPDTGFAPVLGGGHRVSGILVQPDGKILVAGNFETINGKARRFLGRLLSDGTLDSSFDAMVDGEVETLLLQVDGKIIVQGKFNNVRGEARPSFARLNTDGALDEGFNPELDAPVTAVALQADGKILLSGTFSRVGGQVRLGLARLENYYPATDNLSATSQKIVWLRGGASPEVWRTEFESSISGYTWTALGAGKRIPGGWELGGLPLPPGARVRARGFVVNGGTAEYYVESYAGAPVVLTPATAEFPEPGRSFTLAANAVGTPPFSFRWQKAGVTLADGIEFSGAGTGALTINEVSSADAGEYSVVVDSASGSVTSVVAHVSFGPPTISRDPESVAALPGEKVLLSVIAQGTPPLTYQWRNSGAVLVGAAAPYYTVASAGPADAGAYVVVVANRYGSITSSVATLSYDLPVIEVPPSSLEISHLGRAAFEVVAASSGPMSYQWLFNEARLDGATNSTLVLELPREEQAGNYWVVVANASGAVKSAVATLTVVYPPEILAQPQNTTTNLGATVSFRVIASGTPLLTYQWRKNGTAVPLATADALKFSPTRVEDAGTYDVVVSSSYGSVTSAVAQLTLTQGGISEVTFTYADFSGVSGLQLLEAASQEGNRLGLNPAAPSQYGSAYYGERVLLSQGFETTFSFIISDVGGAADGLGNPGGDGLAFVIQKHGPDFPRANAGYIPYNIPDALAVEFDTWLNGNLSDPDGNHISLHFVGPSPDGLSEFAHSRSLVSVTPSVDLSDGAPHTATIHYENKNVTIRLDGGLEPILSVPLDLENVNGRSAVDGDGMAWVGLVAGGAAAYEAHRVLNWSLTLPKASPTLHRAAITGQTFSFGFTGVLGQVYELLRAESLSGPWAEIGSMVVSPDGSGHFEDWVRPSGSVFYRVALVPR